MKNIGKTQRVLDIYKKFEEGKPLDKKYEAAYYGVSQKTIQRDIDEIRAFIAERSDIYGPDAIVKFSKRNNEYQLNSENYKGFNSAELFAVSKILLDSRAFRQSDMNDLLCKFSDLSSTKEEKILLDKALANEIYHYTELQHKTEIKENLWLISQAIQTQNCIRIGYMKEKNNKLTYRILQPMGIIFSEFYFYLVAFIIKEEDDIETKNIDELYPIIYRIDRINELDIMNLPFRINHTDRFQEGEFKKRIQFMQGGRFEHITFEFVGESIEAVMDRLPTAKVRKLGDGRYEVRAETYGRGIDMWIRSQGDRIVKVEKRKI